MLTDEQLRTRVSDRLNQNNMRLLELGLERVPYDNEKRNKFEYVTARVLDNGRPKSIAIDINLENDHIEILREKKDTKE